MKKIYRITLTKEPTETTTPDHCESSNPIDFINFIKQEFRNYQPTGKQKLIFTIEEISEFTI
jgi:hypothetical protein